jgi:hypothetical protein
MLEKENYQANKYRTLQDKSKKSIIKTTKELPLIKPQET